MAHTGILASELHCLTGFHREEASKKMCFLGARVWIWHFSDIARSRMNFAFDGRAVMQPRDSRAS